MRIARKEEARVKVKKLQGRLRKVIIAKRSLEEQDQDSKNLLDTFVKTLVARRRHAVFSHVKV